MKFSLKILAIAVIAATTCSLTSCSAPSGFSYSNIGIAISITCSDCPAGIVYNPALPQPPASGSAVYVPTAGEGGTILLTAAVTNAPPANVTWTIYPQPNLTIPNQPPTSTTGSPGAGTSSVGSFNTPGNINSSTATGANVYYSQGGIPVYSGAALQQAEALGIPQGDVLIVASVPSDPNNPSATVSTSQLVQVFNGSSPAPPTVYLSPVTPTTPAGLTDSVAFVPRGTSFQFYGGAVGDPPCVTSAACGSNPLNTTDNTVTWEVGGTVATVVPGGSTTYGTISSTGLYTAPVAIPPTNSPLLAGQVVVICASHALSTVTKIAYVTVQ